MLSGLFQGDMDFDISSELADEAGLYIMQEKDQAKAKAAGDPEEVYKHISYEIYAPVCSDPDFVREYLDCGILKAMIEERETKILAPANWEGPVYEYVLLGACAMTLGCQLPDSYLAMLKLLYTEYMLFRDGREQMKKTLFGPDGFENGVPYGFESKDLVESANAISEEICEHDEDEYTYDKSPSMIIKELRDKHSNPNACGGCGVKAGNRDTTHFTCDRCNDRMYCSKKCQVDHWRVHKKICKAMRQ
jgi:hypothetical protein